MCPLKTSPEWQELVRRFGDGALAAWKMMQSPEVAPSYSVKDQITLEVKANESYFRNAYPSYPTTEALINGFYDRVKGLDYPVVDGVIQAPTPVYLFPKVERVVTSTDGKSRIVEALTKLKNQYGFDFDIINEPRYAWKGAYLNENGISRVVINIAKATEDTPFHEYYHPVVRNILNTQPDLFASLSAEIAPMYPHIEIEEAVTTHLGKLAAAYSYSPLLDRFLRYVTYLFRSLFKGSSKALTASSTLREVMDTLLFGDPSTENNLSVAHSMADRIAEAMAKFKNGQYFEDKIQNIDRDYIKEITDDNTADPYSTEDDTNEYTSQSGKKVTRLTAFIGDKEIGVFSQKYRKYTDSFAEHQVKELYKMRGVSTDQPLQRRNEEGQLEQVTFRELVGEVEQILQKERLYGKLVHAYVNYVLEWDKDKKEQAKAILYKYAEEFGLQGPQYEYDPRITAYYDGLEQTLKILNLRIPLNDETQITKPDRIAPEVVIISDMLGLGTTADGLIQHDNNEVSLIDWKTGNIMKDYNSSIYMVYGREFDIADTKLNRAKLEMAFRALMLKEKYPDMLFRNIRVVKLNKEGIGKYYEVDLEPYLGMIGAYYKDTNRTTYDTLVAKGLLKAETYGGTHLSLVKIESKIADLPYDDKVAYVQEALNDLTLRFTKEEIEGNHQLKKARADYARALLELKKLPNVNLAEDTPDLNSFMGSLKNLGDIQNRQVQTLHKVKLEAEHAMRQEKAEIHRKHTALLEDVLAENTPPSSTFRNILKVAAAGVLIFNSPYLIPGIFLTNYVVDRFGKSTKDVWGWMWKKSDDIARPGYYLNTTDVDPNTGAPLTNAQKAYRDFVVSTMRRKWKDVMTKPLGKGNTARYLDLPQDLPEDFMPRIFMDTKELREAKGFGGNLRQWGKKHITGFFDEIEGDATKGGAPIRFYAHTGSGIVAGENHSFNVEKAFNGFIGMLLEKEYKDDVYALAEGTKNALLMEKSDLGGEKYKNLAEFLDSQIYIHFLNQTKPGKLTTKDLTVPINAAFAKILGIPAGTYKIPQEKLLRMIKSGLSLSVMGFKLVGSTFNAMLITMTNASLLTRKLVSKGLGLPDDDYEPSFQSVSMGLAGVIDFWKHSFLGTTHKSKLWNIAVMADWMPDNYDYTSGGGNLLSSTPSMTFNSYAFMMTNFVESYGALWHLGIMLRSMKLRTKEGKEFTAWEAFNNDGTWKKGYERTMVEVSKGVYKQLNELDALEWKNLKRQYEKLHGSYRKEEQVALEATIWGQFVIQFKRYLPTFLKNLYASPYKDITVGKYMLTDIKRPDGMPVARWEEELMVGRYRVFGAAMLAGALPHTAKFKNLDVAKQKQFSVLMNTFLWLMLAFVMFMPDDEDEDTYAGWRYKRLVEDMSQGANPLDVLHAIEKPIIVLSKTSDIAEAFWNATSDIVTGDRSRTGDIRGLKTLGSTVPILSNIQQLSQMVNKSKLEEKYIFGVVPIRPFESTNR